MTSRQFLHGPQRANLTDLTIYRFEKKPSNGYMRSAMTEKRPDVRWGALLGMLERIASLDFSRSLTISDKADELDAVASGLNVVSEELEAGVVQRSRLEEVVTQLEVANKDLEAFSASPAHDLRSPLLIVTNFSHYLRESLGDSLNEQEDEYRQRIWTAGHHMIHIVDDLRDLADVNRIDVRRADVDLSGMAREIINDLRVLVPDRDVRFTSDPKIMAVGDQSLLRVLLTNLIQNAWKYTGRSDGAWIELGVAEDEGDVPTYYVRDNGIGFDNVNRDVIFQAFERLHTRAEFAGSGLGLATVERIVRRHGGRVWAEGTPGEGAVFRFTLAQVQEVTPADAPAS